MRSITIHSVARSVHLVSTAMLCSLLMACSSGAGSGSGARVARSPAKPGSTAAAASSTVVGPHVDTAKRGDGVPDGTLTWTIVYSGELAQSDGHGGGVDIAHADTKVRYTVSGRAELSGVRRGGTLVWQADASDKAAACALTINGTETLEWRGRVQVATIGKVPFRGDYRGEGATQPGCAGGGGSAIALKADAKTRHYALTLPASQAVVRGKATFSTRSSHFQTTVSFADSHTVKLPAITQKGGLPPVLQTIGGEQTLHGVVRIPAHNGAVKLRTRHGGKVIRFDAGKRPVIPLDAYVHWILTLDSA